MYFVWVARATKNVRWSILTEALIGLIRVGISLLFVYVCKELIDIATKVSDSSLFTYSIALFAIILMQIILSALNTRVRSSANANLTNHLRNRLFASLMYSRYNGRKSRHTGDVINRLESDVQVVSSTMSNVFPTVVATGFQFLTAFIFLLYLESTLAWITALIMPVCLILSKLFIKKMRALTHAIRNTDSRVQSFLQESLQHLTLYQILEYETKATDKLSGLQDELYGCVMQKAHFSIFSHSLVSFAFALGYSIAFLWGVHGILLGTVSYGMMTAFLQLVGQIQSPLVNLSQQIPAFIHASASIDRLLELENEPKDLALEPYLLKGQLGVRFENVDYIYPDGTCKILDQFTHNFTPGSRTAILGETGAGKSTVIRLILSILHPREGKVFIYNEKEEVAVSPATRCNMVYVPQGNSLLSGTIRDNLLLGNAQATDEEMKFALHMAAADFVDSLPEQLDTPCSERGAGFSEGQAQRIAIARALLRKGGILLLDEFSSSLDEETENRLLHNLTSNYPDRTMIFITHRPKVTEYCNQVLHIDPA